MGYDDNTPPLKGVTGGGLPAEIWRETMLRVHEGLPARPPLPMIHPDPNALADPLAGPGGLGVPETAGRGGNGRGGGRPPRGNNNVGDVIEDILRSILGGG